MPRLTLALTSALFLASTACARTSGPGVAPDSEHAPGECVSWRVEVFNRAQVQGVAIYYQVGSRADPTVGTQHDRTSRLGWVEEGMTEVFMVTSPTEPQVVAKVSTGGLERTVRSGVSIFVRCVQSSPPE
jgi:hypothetical protein